MSDISISNDSSTARQIAFSSDDMLLTYEVAKKCYTQHVNTNVCINVSL